MERDERRRADALDRYWDAVQRGEQPARSSHVDDFAAAVVARVNEGHARPNIDTYHRRVRLRVLEQKSQKEDPMLTLAHPGMRRPVTALELLARRPRFAPLAAALVLMLVTAAGYLAIVRDGNNRPNSIPAAVVATPSPDDPVFETVFTMALPAEEMPSSENRSAGLAVFTIPVDHRAIWDTLYHPGPMIEYVVEGSYGVRAAAPIEVVRANGATEKIAAGTEVTLGTGDTLISRNETVVEVWNAGDIPVALLNWMYIEGAEGHLVSGWTAGQSDVWGLVTLPQKPSTVTLMRVTLPNGGEAALPYPEEVIHHGVQIDGTGGYVTRRNDDTIRIRAKLGAPFVAYVLTVVPDTTAGTPPTDVVATPSQVDPVMESVFTTTLPAEAMPSGTDISAGLALFTIPVGHRATWEPTCCPGPMIEYVVEGTYGVRAAAPIEVVRANGATEEIAAGTEVTLAAGDALISRNQTVVEVWNAGDIPVVLVNWMMIDGAVGHNVAGWATGPTGIRFAQTPPKGLATVTLMRVTLPNGGEVAIDDPGATHFGARLDDSDGYVTHRSDGSVEVGSMPGAPFVAYVLRLEPDSTAGTSPSGSPEASISP